MSSLRSVNRSVQLDLYRRAERVLLSQARPHWLGTRRGLKRIVRRYVRRYGEAAGLRTLLLSGARAAAAALFLLQMYAAPADATVTPSFEQVGLGLRSTGSFRAPAFADMDGDGDLDLISGTHGVGFKYLENTGSSSNPAFAAESDNPFGLNNFAQYNTPAFVDLDNDGDLDLMNGWRGGDFQYFANTGSSSNPAFAAITENPFGLTDIGNYASPAFADMDGDGDLDLLAGEQGGNFKYFANTGNASNPAFLFVSDNPFGLTGVPNLSSPAFADLDGDGDLDLMTERGAGGTFTYFENTGSSSNPAFALVSDNPFGLKDTGSGPHGSAFADLDGDGDLDLVAGGPGGLAHFENTGNSSNPAFALDPLGLSTDDPGGETHPAFADLDNDGDLDMMIGDRSGDFYYFENTGSASNPAFALPSENPFGLTYIGDGPAGRASPTFADLDGDGDLDLLSGHEYGNFVYFENTGSASNPVFGDLGGDDDDDDFAPSPFAPVTNPFGLTDIGDRSSPAFADLDGDGDLDLLSGDYYGNFHYFENTGTSSNPAFAPVSENPFGLTGVEYYGTPTFADLDGDGDLDLLSGDYYGNFHYFENTGSFSNPAFAAVATNPFGLKNIGEDSAPAFADLDGDGDQDLLSGENNGDFFYFENTSPPFVPPVPVVLTLGDDFGAPGDTLRIDATLTNPTSSPVGGLQFTTLLDNPSAAHFTGLEDTTGNAGFSVFTNTVNDSTRIVILSTSGAVIQPGTDIHLATLVYALDPTAALGSTNGLTPAGPEIGDSLGVTLLWSRVNGALQTGIRGDVDLDGRVAIFDLIQLVRIIIGRDAAPVDGSTAFNIADANGIDGIDVADVIAQANTILGITPPTKVISGAPVTVSLGAIQMTPDGRSVIPVYLSDPGSIAGAQGILQFDPSAMEIGTPQLATPRDGLNVDSFVKDGTLRFVVYDTRADGRIAQPDGPMLLIPVTGVTGEDVSVTLSGVRLANHSAQSIPVTAGDMTVSLSSKAGVPQSFGLRDAAPNPFNPATTIAYDVPQQAHIRLTVYNLLGQEVIRLVDQAQTPGRYTVTWNGRNTQDLGVASGIYMYRMSSDTGYSETKRMTLLK